MSPDDTSHLTSLGRVTQQPQSPDEARLEPIPWSNDGRACVRYTCPEFTSLCPVTGQPDFAHITIDYVPDEHLVESKSLKLFLASFRSHQGFHESTTMMIVDRFAEACEPHWLRVAALWYPRGGIPIDIFWQSGDPLKGVYIPAIDLMPFRGR